MKTLLAELRVLQRYWCVRLAALAGFLVAWLVSDPTVLPPHRHAARRLAPARLDPVRLCGLCPAHHRTLAASGRPARQDHAMIVPALAASALARIAPVLGAGLGRLWAAIRSPAVLAILALALGWQTLRIEGLHWTLSIAGLRLPVIARDGLRDRLATAQADLARVTAAQAQARADQAAANHHPPPSRPGSRRSPMPKLPDIMRKGAAGAAWAAAHSLHDACPARGPADPALPRADHPAPLDDRSGDTAALVALPAPTSTSAPPTAPASPRCIRTPSP
jgi:hypothetical protein